MTVTWTREGDFDVARTASRTLYVWRFRGSRVGLPPGSAAYRVGARRGSDPLFHAATRAEAKRLAEQYLGMAG